MKKVENDGQRVQEMIHNGREVKVWIHNGVEVYRREVVLVKDGIRCPSADEIILSYYSYGNGDGSGAGNISPGGAANMHSKGATWHPGQTEVRGFANLTIYVTVPAVQAGRTLHVSAEYQIAGRTADSMAMYVNGVSSTVQLNMKHSVEFEVLIPPAGLEKYTVMYGTYGGYSMSWVPSVNVWINEMILK